MKRMLTLALVAMTFAATANAAPINSPAEPQQVQTAADTAMNRGVTNENAMQAEKPMKHGKKMHKHSGKKMHKKAMKDDSTMMSK